MKVYLASAVSERQATFVPWLENLAARDTFKVHTLVNDPDVADVILFLDGNSHGDDFSLSSIRRHPLTVKHRAKTFLYDERDQTWCAMPGLYVGMAKSSFNRARQRAVAYVSMMNELVLQEEFRARQPDLLFSFIGRRIHPTRDIILDLSHPRGLIQDSSDFDVFKGQASGNPGKQRYAEVLGRTKFVLCPRGAGHASYRLFETMAMGRVPVIISDEWVAPEGPDWNKVAIRIRERDVAKLVTILEEKENCFEVMAHGARRAWEEWFSPEVLFHRMVENCGEIMKNRVLPEAVCRPFFDRRFLYLWVRSLKWRVYRSMARKMRCGIA